MSTTTAKWGLFKPELNDPADITQMNKNWDIIDDKLNSIPVTSEVPEDADIWIDPDENTVEESHLTDKNNPHNVTAEQVGASPMEYTKKVGNPHNLLDNSDFRNPVNQRGFTSGSVATNAYFIDRWKAWSPIQISGLSTNGLQMTSGVLRQDLTSELTAVLVGKRITFAAKIDGTVCVCHATVSQPGVYTQLAVNAPLEMAVTSGGLLCCGIRTSSAITIEWAALYEGEYTAETLPEYQPKGYGVELAECQRYLLMGNPMGIVTNRWDKTVGFCIPTPVTMRSGNPTVFGNFFVHSTDNTSVRLNCQIANTISKSNNVYLYCVLDDATAAQKACSFNFEDGGGLSMEL